MSKLLISIKRITKIQNIYILNFLIKCSIGFKDRLSGSIGLRIHGYCFKSTYGNVSKHLRLKSDLSNNNQ